MILCVGTTPAVQRLMVFRKLALDSVNRALTTIEGPAGKSVNVAQVLQALGESPLAVGFQGGDRGNFLAAALGAKEIDYELISVASRTRQCVTVIDESAGTHTELVEESAAVRAADYARLLHVIRARVPECRAVVLSGSIPPGGPPDLYFQCVNMARKKGLPAIVDAQGTPLAKALKARPALVKPNRAELGATLGKELKDEQALRQAMLEICARGAERVVVTAGKAATLAYDGKLFWRIFSAQIKVANPIGSGDAFTAGLVWRLLRGDDLGEACRWGSAAGSANAMTLLPGDVDKKVIERLARKVKVERVGA